MISQKTNIGCNLLASELIDRLTFSRHCMSHEHNIVHVCNTLLHNIKLVCPSFSLKLSCSVLEIYAPELLTLTCIWGNGVDAIDDGVVHEWWSVDFNIKNRAMKISRIGHGSKALIFILGQQCFLKIFKVRSLCIAWYLMLHLHNFVVNKCWI